MWCEQERRQSEESLQRSLKEQDSTKFQLEDSLAYKRSQALQHSYAEQLQQVALCTSHMPSACDAY